MSKISFSPHAQRFMEAVAKQAIGGHVVISRIEFFEALRRLEAVVPISPEYVSAQMSMDGVLFVLSTRWTVDRFACEGDWPRELNMNLRDLIDLSRQFEGDRELKFKLVALPNCVQFEALPHRISKALRSAAKPKSPFN